MRQRQSLANARSRRIPGDVAPGQHDSPAVRLDRAGDNANERGFAGAIRTDQSNKFAGRNRKRHTIHRVHPAEMHGEILKLERRNHGFAGAVNRRVSPARPPGARRITRTNKPPKTNKR